MSERDDSVYVRHILDAAQRVLEYTAGMSQEAFLADPKTQDAIIRQLEILGEATKRISRAFQDRHPHIPWSDMARMRDVLIHHYFRVDLEVVWQAVKKDLPALVAQLEGITDQA